MTAAPPSHSQDVKAIEPNRGGEVNLETDDPKVARERLFPAEGYDVQLFASEKDFPLLANPVAMSFDGRGRLFVSTMPSYPQRLPDTDPDDKILILEDADHDGVADKCDVYADKLHVPTGFELGDGGAYISEQPDIIFVKDTDGDGKADYRETVLHGFGTEDSHHAIHVFVWGPDGGLYFQEGTFHHSQVETPYGPVRLVDAGIFRYKPSQQYLEVFVTYPFANPWGHIFDKWGQNFIADASGGSNYVGLPITGYKPYPKKSSSMKVFTSVVRPTAGCEIVSSRHFPEDAQGDFLVNNCIGFQGIKHHHIIEEGSGYTSEEKPPLLYSTDINFRPVDIEFGPDGALYIVDWFNPLIGHMQYSLRDPNRDHSHGRVWRITYKNKPLITPVHTEGKSIPELLDALKEYEDRTRYRARNELRNRNADEVLTATDAWIAALDPADPQYEHNLLEALWVKQSINRPDPALLDRMLSAQEPRARAAAVRVARHWRREVPDILPRLEKAVTDEFPRTRLEAVTALSYMDSWEAQRAAIKVRGMAMDYYLDYGLNETTRALEEHWKPAVLAAKLSLDDDPGVGEFLASRMSADELAQVLSSPIALQRVLTQGGASDDSRRKALAALAQQHGGDAAAAWLDAVGRASQAGGEATADTLEQYARLLAEVPDEALQPHAAEWERLAKESHAPKLRQAALVAVVRADNNAERAWKLAQEDPGLLMELLAAAPQIHKAAWRNELYPLVRGLLDGEGKALSTAPLPPGARYVRIDLPGEHRVLTVAELEVYSNHENVAKGGSARQSSVAYGGEASRAIDGNNNGSFANGGQTHTNEESTPWLELDLGRNFPISFVRVMNRTDEGLGMRLDGFKLTVMDENHVPIFSKEGIAANERSIRVDVQTDPAAALRRAVLPALAALDTGKGDTFALLAKAFANADEQALAAGALTLLDAAAWHPEEAAALAESISGYMASASPEDLASPGLRAAGDAGAQLAALLPVAEAGALRGKLAAHQLQRRRVKALQHKMQYDTTELVVRAGAPVELTLENPDIMPHNLVVVQPGKYNEIGAAADAETTSPEAAARDYVPEHPAVVVAITLVQPGQSKTIRFNAPTEPGDYPYVCTYPGHWRVMKGMMHVLEELPETSGGGQEATFVKLWNTYDLSPAIDAANSADVALGAKVFERAACSRCHSSNENERALGQPLTELRGRFYAKELLDQIVNPSRRVAEEYRRVAVTLKDGRAYEGVKVSETPEALVLRQDAMHPDITVALNPAEIASTGAARVASPMPRYLLSSLSQQEIYALLAFILHGDEPGAEHATEVAQAEGHGHHHQH